MKVGFIMALLVNCCQVVRPEIIGSIVKSELLLFGLYNYYKVKYWLSWM